MDGPSDGSLVSQRLFEWLEHTGGASGMVAEQEQLSPTTVSNLLNARIDRPRLSTVRKLARHFGVSVEEFLAGPKVRAPATRIVSELRALPFETRTIFFEAMASADEPSTSGANEPLILALKGLADKPLVMTLDEFFEFILHTSADEAREVLFAGAETGEEKRRAGAAFVSAIAGSIRQGRITGSEITERLNVAGLIQAGAA